MSQRKSHRAKKGETAQTQTSAPHLLVLTEMFPAWEAEELASILSEHHDDVETVIDLIVNNKVSKWEPIKREQKQKKRDDHILEAAPASNPPQSEHKKFPRGERAPKDKKRERKPKPQTQAAASAAPASSGASAAPQTQAAPAASTTSASSAPVNSWAAALSKDKPKPSKKEVKDEPKQSQETQPQQQQKQPQQTQQQPQEPQQPQKQQEEAKPVQATSWASAIKPKAPAPKKKAQPEAEKAPEVKNLKEEPVEEVTQAEASESEVVLPQQVDNIGVSFGSLSLQKDAPIEQEQLETPAFAKEEASETIQQPQTQQAQPQPQQPQTQQPQTQQPQQPQQQPQQQPAQSAQPAQSTQQAAQQAYQQQFEQQKSGNQGFDYYTQFQQTQQQFPQQAGAGSIPGQFAYPSFDYSAAYGQTQNGLASSASPGYFQPASGKSASSAANGESTQSPLVSSAQQGLQTPQQNQQMPGAAPFGYPNYYNYYYNTPYYGNGAAMGGVSNNAYGMQHQQYPQAQQQQGESASEPEATSGQANPQAANQYYAAQYYGNPNQFGTRGGYPYSGYPSNQPAPQSGHGSEPLGEQNGQQHGTPQAPGPSQPQYPQQVPQYGGYQQYPQYGSYQDSNQYRGWY